MNFIRKLFGQSSQPAGPGNDTRRSSHVTPSRSPQPIREPAPTIQPEPEITKPPPPVEETAEPEPPIQAEIIEQENAPEPELPAAASPAPEIREAPVQPQPVPAPTVKPILTRQAEALSYGIASDVGRLRGNNEDACFGMQWHSITIENRPDFGFFIVADGIGGHLDGERAASIAVQTLAAEMLQHIYVPMLRDFKAGDSPTILDALVAASEKANLAVIKHVPGGGTTLSAVAIVGNLAYLVHVGDSRAYLIDGDKIEQLTTDHTLVQRLIEMNELKPEEAEHYPQKNVLYRAIGQNEQLKVERLIRTLPPASFVLICTDGLWDMVDDDTLRQVTLAAPTPQEACDQLVKLANDRGGVDNISVIIFKVPGNAD